MRNKPFSYKGILYDLGHLITTDYQTSTTHQPNGMSVKVVYSCHCFTEAAPVEDERNPTYILENEHRYFSIDRHTLSLNFPNIISTAIERAKSYKVFSSTDRNGAHSYVILREPNSDRTYCVFFALSKRSLNDSAYTMMTIKSAYLNESYKSSSRDKTNLGTLFDKIMGQHPQRRNHKRKRQKK